MTRDLRGDVALRSLFVLADAAPMTGVGHHVRCSALASELASRGWSVNVIRQRDTVDWVLADVRARGWGVVEVPGGDLLAALVEAADGTPGRTVLLVDSYRVGEEWLARARARFPGVVVVIDDMGDRYLHADVVVNQNVGAEDLDVRADEDTQLLRGPRYALLRSEITMARDVGLRTTTPASPRRILVVMGGTDPSGSAPAVAVGCARALPDAEVLVVAPDGTVEGQRISSVPRIAAMGEALLGADLVVTAAGSTLWEAFCLARPVAAVQVARNQADVYRRLLADGVIIGLGVSPVSADDVAEVLSRELSSAGTLLRIARAGARIIDGRGAARVASVIEHSTERWSNA